MRTVQIGRAGWPHFNCFRLATWQATSGIIITEYESEKERKFRVDCWKHKLGDSQIEFTELIIDFLFLETTEFDKVKVMEL